MVVRELLPGVDDAVQVRVHQLRHDVHVVEVRHGRRLDVQHLVFVWGMGVGV